MPSTRQKPANKDTVKEKRPSGMSKASVRQGAAASGPQQPSVGQGAAPVHLSASMPFGEASIPSSWEALPSSALAHVLDLLPLRDLAAAACTCKAWHAEAAHDDRWARFWRAELGEQALWGWAKAGGGFREQLRARAAVRKGHCTATVFPLSRLDGAVVEVLLRDGGAWRRIITAQVQSACPGSVRLKGATIKVWDGAGLVAGRPLLVVHDVVKHIQLEDGRLLLWRVANDAIIRIRCLDPSDAAAAAEVASWAEHPDIVPSILDVATLTVTDLALDARYGRGKLPLEWQDMFAGCVGCVVLDQPARSVRARLFDAATGACVRESECGVPEAEGAPDWGEVEMSCIMSRSADPRAPLLVAAILFDCRTFMWRLPPVPLTQWQRRSSQQQQQEQQEEGEEAGAAGAGGGRGAAAGDAADSEGHEQQRQQQGQPEAEGQEEGEGVAWGELEPMFTTLDHEPVVDVSVSTAGGRIFVVGVENIYLLSLAGQPQMVVSMAHWRGVPLPTNDMDPLDVGAFSWPLPMSHKAAFYLDSCSSLFIAEFRRPQVADFMVMHDALRLAGDGRHPHFDNLVAANPQGIHAQQPYYVQAHTDLRPSQPGMTSSLAAGRTTSRAGCAQEPVIVEYPQEGSTVFTVGDSSCPAVAKLLKLEKDRGSYLQGLGPSTTAAGGSRGGRRVVEGSNGGGSRSPVAPRAIVCIDTATGIRYKAVPIDGVIEAIHSAGQYLVVAVAGRDSYPAEGSRGSLVVLDFTQRPGGFGAEQQAERRGQGGRAAQQAALGGPLAGAEREEDQEGAGPGKTAGGKEARGSAAAKAGRQGKRGGAGAAEASDAAAAGKKRAKRK